MSLFRRLGRATLTLGAVGVGGAGATLAGMGLWTRKCSFEPFGPETDPLFKHALLKLTNPYNKPYTYDSCTRTLNYSAVQPALLEDARQGGTKLIEAFAAGMWGGYGYAVQRKIMLLTKDDSCRDDLWEKEELLRSTFQPGTYFTNHFAILSKTPRSIIFRGCFAPRQSPPAPQNVDNLCEMAVELDDNAGTVKLALKSITYNGMEGASTDPDPFGGVGGWLHRQYAKLLVESGADNCVQ